MTRTKAHAGILGGILMVSTITGCTTQSVGPRAIGGTALGAAAGGLLAAVISRGNPAAITAGVLVGGGTGWVAGDVLDRHARDEVQRATRQALVTQQPVAIIHDGRQVTAKPRGWSVNESGLPCQQTDIVVILHGKPYTSTVCAVPGAEPGTWNIGPEAYMVTKGAPQS